MSLQINEPVVGVPAKSPTGPSGRTPEQEARFEDHLQPQQADACPAGRVDSQGVSHVGAPQPAEAVARGDVCARTGWPPITGAQIPNRQHLFFDTFSRHEKVRRDCQAYFQKCAEFDERLDRGEIKMDDPKVQQQRREEMRMLLHFQMEMQNASMQVEIASKLVEHVASDVKTVLSTQA